MTNSDVVNKTAAVGSIENAGADSGVSAEDMALINQLARRELKAEEVYVFPVTLCDNETDRDCERFSVSALAKLAELFVGKTGIFDHDPKGANQTARIFRAELAADESRSTRSGEPYRCVKAMAYMMRTEKNADLIAEIDGGIKKEVSVCCSVGRKICSICGADERKQPCTHIKGEYYSGKLCEKILEEPSDAYEWSFVAIPAQPNAGVTKSGAFADRKYDLSSEEIGMIAAKCAELKRENGVLENRVAELKSVEDNARADAISEIIRLGRFCVPSFGAETIKAVCSEMSYAQLLEFKKRIRKDVMKEYAVFLIRP